MIVHDGRTDEYYNQKYLKPIDAEFLRGFDWATEMAVDNFFANVMFELADEGAYLGHVLCEKLPENMQEKYIMHHAFGDKTGEYAEEPRTATTYADLIQLKLLEWIEMERNQLITGMLEELSDEEYNEIKAKVDGRGTESDRKPS